MSLMAIYYAKTIRTEGDLNSLVYGDINDNVKH